MKFITETETILKTGEEIQIIEKKIKKLDSQIALLTELKTKYINKLNLIANKSTGSSISSSNSSIDNPYSSSYSAVSSSTLKDFLTADEKINIFKNYFMGRDDLYARLWKSHKTGKQGYSPVCRNEWIPALCRKPKVKCTNCSNRKFLPYDYSAVKMHLTGKHIAGIYPLTKDEKCYFLAFDFDGDNWFEDAVSLKTICLEENLHSAIERSRSGEGGHLWIFFKDKIPAITARKLGTYLITKTISKNFKFDMKSYDRMFPNQDTMPEGGFGNLIALPFQKEAVLNGNSVFIDENCSPYDNQWNFLSSVKKINLKDVLKILSKAEETQNTIEISNGFVSEEESWDTLNTLNLKSEKTGIKKLKTIENLPEYVESIQSNRIYIKSGGVPSPLLSSLKSLASFQNPEFYKKQKLRLSTYSTPRIISCAELTNEYLSLPRGCLEGVESILKDYNVKLNNHDKRFKGKKIKTVFNGMLTGIQQNALNSILNADSGILVAPPGTGKTVIAIAVVAKRKTSTLILVHRKPLMEQWQLQISALLGIDKKEIGIIGGGKNNPTGNIDIATIQSLNSRMGNNNHISRYGFIIIDECHHIGAFSFEKVLNQTAAKYILGLTATPYRKDGHEAIINMQCGKICHEIKQKDLKEGFLKVDVIIKKTEFSYAPVFNKYDQSVENIKDINETCRTKIERDKININDLWNDLIEDKGRNELIVGDIACALKKGLFPLVLTERKKHIDILADMLKDKTDFIAVFYGGAGHKTNKEMLNRLKDYSKDSKRVVLATGSYIGEGFDEPELNALFLTIPVSFKGRIVQYTGRLSRNYKDKQNIYIYDYLDENVPLLTAMHKKRIKTYKLLDYNISG